MLPRVYWDFDFPSLAMLSGFCRWLTVVACVAQGLDVSSEDIVVQTGCGAILSNMFQLLAEPGESVLIPAPYYPAFENDMKVTVNLAQ